MAEDAEKALRWVREAKVLSYDTETSGVDWKRNQPVGYVFAVDSASSVYIPVRHGGGGNLLDPAAPPLTGPEDPIVIHRFERELAEAFKYRDQAGLLTIGHNLKFDMHLSANAGVILNRQVECTQVNEALLNEHASGFGLGDCAKRRGVTAKKGEELYAHMAGLFGGPAKREQMGNFWRLPGNDPLGYDYAAGDGITTLEVWQSQRQERDEQPIDMSKVWQLEADLTRTIWRIERRGIRINENRAKEVMDSLNSRVAGLIAMLPENFNVRSPTDMRRFCEDAGHTDWPKTAPSKRFPEGQPSFTEKWLSTFEEGRRIVSIRESTNLINSFLSPLLERHAFNGRVYPSLHPTAIDGFGTISGRFSCSNPNMQQVPKHNKALGELFRSIFVPDEGMTLFEGDYSQCEPRLFSHYTREPALVDGYNAIPPRDMHRVCADLLSVDRDTVAKRMNMGLLTGLQAKGFAEHMKWEESKAREMFDAWMRIFPGIPGFQKQAKNAMLRRGYVFTLLGRICRLDDARFAYKATSRIIQGGNADIVKYKLLEADRMLEAEGDIVQLLMTIHDSFLWQGVRDDRGNKIVENLRALLVDVQSPPFSLRVPFKLDVGAGENWAIATYGGKA
jgi:DNA polymerase-1